MLAEFRGKKVLLLQGPVGPFFARFARELAAFGAEVHKINFNGGDCLFYPKGATSYRGPAEDWEDFLRNYLRQAQVEVVFLFGDCRPLHRVAVQVAEEERVLVCVFEEGYVRPNCVTLESQGVNGFSTVPRDADFYLKRESARPLAVKPVGKTFWHMAGFAFAYTVALRACWPWFPQYRHHRPVKLLPELGAWIRAGLRYLACRADERRVVDLAASHSKRYFFVPLQVHNDAQLNHSPFSDVRDFIARVVESFAASAPAETLLVFKHHPLDLGYRNYGAEIQDLAARCGVRQRVVYLRRGALASLVDHALGAVMINSTTGMFALRRGIPVIALGTAVYDIVGLTHQGSLESFWKEPNPVKHELYQKFHHWLLENNQIGGSFYKRNQGVGGATGLAWDAVVVRDFRSAEKRASAPQRAGDFGRPASDRAFWGVR